MNLETLILPMKSEDNAFKASISRITQLVTGAIQAIEGMIKVGFEWADQLDSIQDVMGVTADKAASLNFVLRKSKTDTGALTKGMVILEKGLVTAGGKLDASGKKLKDWGINVFDANGKLKDQATLIGEISDKYASFATQQEKVNFLTDTFGKSGAELVDFFDTLAAEGGIDAVTKKVKAFGLAIDPDRYEQFNRNLEELKLIGVGLAVQFTEKVMPILEKFLGWFTEFAMNPDPVKALHQIDSFISGIVNGMATQVNTWLQGGGPEKLSEDVMSWVDNIGKGPNLDIKSGDAIMRLLSALGKAITRIDWIGITDALDAKLAESINNVDWVAVGDNFGTLLTFNVQSGVDNKDSEAIPAIGNAFSRWLLGAVGATSWEEYGEAFRSNIHRVTVGKLEAWGQGEGGASVRAFFQNWEDTWTESIRTMGINSWVRALPSYKSGALSNGQAAGISLVTGWLSTSPLFIGALSTFNALMDSRLRDISKTFFNAAVRWGAQMKAGFNDGLGSLLSAVRGLVDSINKVLKGIITSFAISIKLPFGLTWPGQPKPSQDKSKDDNYKPPGKASGGPVFAGQTYTVGELRPETFTPQTNGRIDNIKNQPVDLSDRSIIKLAEQLTRTIPPAMTKALGSL